MPIAPLGKQGLPPKSPLLAGNKIKAVEQTNPGVGNNEPVKPTMPVIEEKSLAEENYISFAGAQPKNQEASAVAKD